MDADRSLNALLSVPDLSGPVVSPDGDWVAWSWSRLGPAADVFAAPVDGSSPPVRLTEAVEGNTFVTSWTPDGKAVLVRQDTDGDERARLYRVWLDRPGIMEPLTGPDPNYYLGGGQLHPNGRWLFYSANLDAESGAETETDTLYRHDLESGELRALARPKRGSIPWPELNRAGTHVLYTRNERHPAGQQVWLVDVEGREDREILNHGETTKVSASWFPDGRRVLFLAEKDTHRRLGVYDIRDGDVRLLLDDPKRNVEEAFVPPNGGPVVVVGVEDARIRTSLLEPETGGEAEPPEIPGNVVPQAPTPDGWVCKRYDARHPVDLVRLEGGEAVCITGLAERTSLDTALLAAAEDFRWRSVDGLGVQGWLYRTGGDAVGTVVLVHGGPTHHAEDRFNAQVQYLVARGFHVLAPNYRGSTGFGLPFQEKIKEDGWGGREQEDVRAGIEALMESNVAEPGRVGVTGTSYGGYSAWWAITHLPTDLVAAAAPVCGMTDLVVDYHATRPDLRPYSEEMMGGTPEEIPDRYNQRSPINHVANIRGRLLIVQGMRDPNVTPQNVDVVVRALDREGIPYELLTFEDEGHGIARPDNLRVLYPRLADFFEKSFG
jgi:dipeptidyl aminopeptidase/acylaminoacyl peptidase